MCIRDSLIGIHGPFVVGEVDEEPSQEIGLHFTDKVWAIDVYKRQNSTLIYMWHNFGFTLFLY